MPNPAEATVVARIRGWHTEGVLLHRIAARLNGAGVAGKRGGRFYASTIKAIVENDLHTSTRRWRRRLARPLAEARGVAATTDRG